jgi:hypothetical protein
MKKTFFAGVFICACLMPHLSGQGTPVERGLEAISEDVIRAQLGFLASDWTEGREAGEKGESMAADYIASMLQLYGVKPGGDLIFNRNFDGNLQTSERSYFQNFILIKTTPGKVPEMKLKSESGNSVRTTDFTYNVDFTSRSIFNSAETEAPVVFVGYGFVSSKLKINDLEKLELKGKYVLKISGIPLHARKNLTAAELTSSAEETEKYLREKGAVGIIEFSPGSPVVGNAGVKEFQNMSPSEGNPRTGRPRARYSIPGSTLSDDHIRIETSSKTANEILRGTGIVIEDFINKADANQPVILPQLNGKSIIFKTDVITSQIAVRNIIGIIEGNNPDQVIVAGAHYDHMGTGNGYLWNGADDNGSGTVGVMTLAKAVMASGKKPEKSIIFALWTAEELGLLGSRHYVRNLPYPLKNLKLNINFDMISRYISDENPKGVVMTYTKSYPGFKILTENNIKKYNIDLLVDYQPSDDPPGGTDHRSFVVAGIPIMRFKPGHREEYHTPDDELSTINWDIMEKIIRISFANLWELANSSW